MVQRFKMIPRLNLDFHFADFLTALASVGDPVYSVDLPILRDNFGNGKFILTSSGRASLFAILKSMELSKGSKVGVPLYCCDVVFDAIVRAGCLPLFLDVDLETYTLDPHDLEKKAADLDALVVVHTFGHPASMSLIKDMIDGVPLIEDCAHSLFSRYKGRMTGTLGDASFFSFRLGKYLDAGGGGMIFTTNELIANGVVKLLDNNRGKSLLSQTFGCIQTYIRSVFYRKPWYGALSLPIGEVLDESADLMGKRGFALQPMERPNFAVLESKLETFQRNMLKQREVSLKIIEKLRDVSIRLPVEKDWAFCNFYLLPLLFESKRLRDDASRHLSRNGIDSMKFYSEVPEIARRNYGYKGECKNSEVLADSLLVVPNHYSLTPEEIEGIVKALREWEPK